MASYDLSIRGAGIFGLSIAWTCVERGARVELVDPKGLGAGASGGIVGALAPHVPENWNPKKQVQFESLVKAEAFWAGIETAGGRSAGYARHGRIQPLADDHAVALAQGRRKGAKTHWQGTAEWSVQADAGGWQIGSGAGQFVMDTLSAHIHPRKGCLALAAALKNRGVEVVSVASATPAPVIWATGSAGLEALSVGKKRILGQGIKGQAALLKAARVGLPQLFVEGLHIIPHLDGTVAVGSTTEREFEAPGTTDEQLDDILERVRIAVPELADAPVIERWAGLRPRARSRAPMLGQWPEKPGHFIANGGFKIGFGMAPKIADVMADLVLEGRDTIPEGFEVAASV